MFEPYDIQAVKSYVFLSYPELTGRVAIRQFDPPSFLRTHHSDETMNMGEQINTLMRFEDTIRADIENQIAPDHRHEVKQALDEVLTVRLGRPNGGLWRKAQFLDSCLDRQPHWIPIIKSNGDYDLRAKFHYIVGYPNYFDGSKIYEVDMQEEPDHLPPEFERVSRVIGLTHEFGHVLLHAHYPDEKGLEHKVSRERVESVNEVFALGASLAILGEVVLPVMDIAVQGRLRDDEPALNRTTALALEEAMLSDVMELQHMDARQVMHYADNLCIRLGIE